MKITKSWRTTLGGVLLGVGVPLMNYGEAIYQTIGIICTTLGGLLVGVAGRDNVVTSKDIYNRGRLP